MAMNRREHSPAPRGKSTAAGQARKRKLAALAESSEVRAANGRLLEDIVHDHATEFPEWEVERCWRWSEWPRRADFGLPLHDYGIDLVAETVTGRTVAIQCKARGGDGSVTPREIREFAGAAKTHYDECWIVTNAHQGSGAAEALQTSGVIWKDIAAEDAAITEDADDEPDEDPRTAMQDEAVKACVHALQHPQTDLEEKWAADSADVPVLAGVAPVSRTKLILPCGTGKTRTAARIVDELTGDGDLAVILTPSISLVGQTRSAVLRYFRSAGRRTASIVVCSDKTAGHVSEDEHAAAETGARRPTEFDATTDSGQVRAADLGCRTASSGGEVAEWVGARGHGSRLNLIVGTYQSAHHVAEGLKTAGVAARIIVCDETHRTAQIRPSKGKKAAERAANFTCCHEQAILPAQYRLYLTATPRVYPCDNNKVERARAKGYLVASMDDESIFGTEGYRISYPAAVDGELLSDYRIIAFTTNRDTWKTAERIAKRQDDLRVTEAVTWLTYGIVLYGGAMDGDRQVDIRSSIAFLNRTDKSRRLANWLRSEAGKKEITEYLKRRGLAPRPECPTVEHLDAADSAKARRDALDNLASATTEQPHGVCNVGIFGEGTDTPSLNAVAMLAPRRSPTDVIQIVGRCMRRDPMKTIGYVVVPVTLPPDIDAETSLGMETLDEAWEPLGQILSALRAHDGRIEDRVGDLLTICEPSDDPAEPAPRIHAPIEAKDGPVFRRGIWSGAKAGDLEHIIAEADCGKYSRDRPDIRSFLTAERGFTWGEEPTADSRKVPTDLTGNRAEDEQRVNNAPIALAINRTRRKTPEIATYKPVGPRDRETEDPSTAGRSVGIAETLTEGRRRIRENRLRPRDRVKATDPDAGAVIDANSISTFFTPLAEAVLPKTRIGILAKVIPMTGLTAAGGRKERQLLADRFQIRCIVMCHDPKDIHLSQDTAINEALLIGRRTVDGRGTTEPTTFVNLRRYPRSEAEATTMAEAIKNSEWDEVGTACEWPAKRMRDGDWSAGQWYEPELANGAAGLKERPELKTAAELYAFGPPGQSCLDALEPVVQGEAQNTDIRMFNSINEADRSSLEGPADSRYRTRPAERQRTRISAGRTGTFRVNVSDKLIEKYRKSMAHTLVAQRFSTTSSRTTAQYSVEAALGTAYIPVKTASRAEAKTLNLLWNSTPVVLQLLNMRSKKATYPKWSVSQLGSVRLPGIPEDSDAVRRLAQTHDELAADKISRLAEAHTCPTRAAIDAAVAPLFGLDEATVAEWRRLLAAEPLMHNQMPDETFEENE